MVIGARVAPRLNGPDAIAALAPSERDFPRLTTRERQVLGLVAEGQSNAQIADALAVSGKTVANYVSALLSSLHARDRTHLAELVNTRRRSLHARPPPAETPERENVPSRRPVAITESLAIAPRTPPNPWGNPWGRRGEHAPNPWGTNRPPLTGRSRQQRVLPCQPNVNTTGT